MLPFYRWEQHCWAKPDAGSDLSQVLQEEPQLSLRVPIPTSFSSRPLGGPSCFLVTSPEGPPASPKEWWLHLAFSVTLEGKTIHKKLARQASEMRS